MGKRFRHGLFGLLVGTAVYLILWVVIPGLISFPSHGEDHWYVPLIAIGGACITGFVAAGAFDEGFWHDAFTHFKIALVLNLTAFFVMLVCDIIYMILHPDWEGILATIFVISLFGLPTVKVIEIIIE